MDSHIAIHWTPPKTGVVIVLAWEKIADYFVGELIGSNSAPSGKSSPGWMTTVWPPSRPATTSVSAPKSRPSWTFR